MHNVQLLPQSIWDLLIPDPSEFPIEILFFEVDPDTLAKREQFFNVQLSDPGPGPDPDPDSIWTVCTASGNAARAVPGVNLARQMKSQTVKG